MRIPAETLKYREKQGESANYDLALTSREVAG